ncbi:MAG: tetratricopeptide repeat protein, partial [Hyphomicrobiaceae bacterium]
AAAAKMMFGTKEYLHKIQDLDLRGQNGEALYLGYKFSHHSFIAPYRTTDDGYILGVVGEQRYYPLTAALIERLQAQKRLPVPLPPYELSALDYFFGHLLWMILAGIAVFILFSILKQRRSKKALPFAQAGLAHHRAGNLDAAIAEYGKALEFHPKSTDVLMLRGDAHKALGEFDSAISDYSKIINMDAKNAPALVARGAAFEAKRMLPRAIDDYTRAIKSSKAPVAYFMRANAYMGSGEMAAAIKDYTSAIDKNNDFAAAYQNRAIAYERTGRADLAQADYRLAGQIADASQAAQQS